MVEIKGLLRKQKEVLKMSRVICSLVALFLIASQAVAQEKPVYGFPEAFPEIHAFFDWEGKDFEKDGYGEGVADFNVWDLHLLINSAVRENINLGTEMEFGHRYYYKYFTLVQTKVDWKLNQYAGLTFGKFFVPFGPGPEKNYYASFRKLPSRPYIYSFREQLPREYTTRPKYWRVFPVSLPSNNWRDVGLGFKGEAAVAGTMKVNYDLALVNGLQQEIDCLHCHPHQHYIGDVFTNPGKSTTTVTFNDLNQYLRITDSTDPHDAINGKSCINCHALHHRIEHLDNNSNKTIVGRIGFSPKEGIEIGASFATGKYDKKEKYGVNLLGIDGQVNLGKLSILGEYVSRKVEADKGTLDTGTPTGEKGSFTLESYYAQVAYKILEGRKHLNYLEAILRYDAIDPNTDVDDDLDRNRTTLGLALSPYKHTLFKLEYQMVKEPNAAAEKKNNGYTLSLSVDF